MHLKLWFAMLVAAWPAFCLEPAGVAIIINSRSSVSKSIGEYYSLRRNIPKLNVIRLATPEVEEISRESFEREIARPVRQWLARQEANSPIQALVLTKGVPLKIRGTHGGTTSDAASVDSELAALRLARERGSTSNAGPLRNPYFGSREDFNIARFSIYLVTRLDGYTFPDVKSLIDRSLQARDTGLAVLDARSSLIDGDGDLWLRAAARALPDRRVLADFTEQVLVGVKDVIAYASWGSNDKARKTRNSGFSFLPGAIVTEYVSTDGRTFKEPPAGWEITTWQNSSGHWAGSPQSLTADFVRQGATGVSGHVYEPYLAFTPRPDYLLPAYIVERRTLAESFWSSIPAVSWMNVVIGDPLCRLKP